MSANTPEKARAVADKAPAASHQVLTLRLGGEESGIDILCAQEICAHEQPTHMAGARVQRRHRSEPDQRHRHTGRRRPCAC